MQSDLWRRLENVFGLLIEASPEDRAAILDRACGDDTEIRAEAQSLLSAYEQADDFLEALDVEFAGKLFGEAVASPVGARIGPYRISHELGHGGMGTVYLADREEGEFEQQVALKVVRWSGLSFRLRERFYSERQILARLEHPGIARLLDGGITENGEPYFAMEVVDGEPITAFCDRTKADERKRLQLFLEVCDAVRYAHRNLVVHRDLKPSNILINTQGRPKLVDFGIATALSAPEEPTSAEMLGLAATPAYTAPEVLQDGTITTGADIFSLAVVLHELMTGRRPESSSSGALRPVDQIPSDSDLDSSSVADGQAQSISRPSSLPRDLESVIHKGLSEDPESRYRTVDDLMDDLTRFLQYRPVSARTPSSLHRLAMFVRRNRTGVAAVLLTTLALIGGLGVSIWQTRQARQQAARAEEIKQFLVQAFQAASPGRARGQEITARSILDEGARRIRDELAGQPDLRIELQTVLGSIYRELGLFSDADSLLSDALSSSLRVFDDDDPRLGSAFAELGHLRLEQSRLQEADSLFSRSLAIRRRALSPSDPATARSLSGLGTTRGQLGRFEESEALHREALGIDMKAFGSDNLAVADDLQDLGWILWREADYVEADSVLRRALAIQRRRLAGDDHEVAITLSTLAKVASSEGRPAEAEGLHREALQLRRRILGPRHPDVALSLSDLAISIERQGRPEEALALFREALDIEEETLGREHNYTINTRNNLAVCYYHAGRLDSAAAEMRSVYEERVRMLGADHPDALTAINNLGVMLHALGRDGEALELLNRAIDTRRAQGREKEIDNGYTLKNLGDVLAALQRHREAAQAYRDALAIFHAKLPPGHERIGQSAAGLGSELIAAQEFEEAIPPLQEAVPILMSSAQPSETILVIRRLADAFERVGKLDEAHVARARADSIARTADSSDL